MRPPAPFAVAVMILLAPGPAHGERTSKDAACPSCNVILVSVDTLRADHLGCYGYARPTSPRLDAFSRESALFTTTIAQAPSTTPSHASIFTSVVPSRHGALRAARTRISSRFPTLAELLRAQGWRTVSFNGGGQVDASFGFDRGFELYDSNARTTDLAGRVTAAARWIGEHADDRFFMFLHAFEVHAPFDPDPALLARFDAGYRGTLPPATSFPVIQEINSGRRVLDAADEAHVIATYDAEIASADAAFGRLLEVLGGRGLADRTLVIFTSDHGESFGEHSELGDHTSCLGDETLKVPLVIRFPGGRFAGRTVPQQVRSVDILPTVLAVLGIAAPSGIDGASLLPLLDGREKRSRVAVAEMDADGEPPRALRTPERKLILGGSTSVAGGSRWYRDVARIPATGSGTRLRLASALPSSIVEVQVEGRTETHRLGPEPSDIVVFVRRPENQVLTLRALTPCVPSAKTDPALDCVSFRIDDGDAFYDLAKDPLERHDLSHAPGRAGEMARLKLLLARMTDRGPSPPPPEPAGALDAEAMEKLRALGYVR